MASLNTNTRTTVSAVTEIFDTDLVDGSMKQHINVAAEMVDDIAAAGSVSSQRLELIETYLAAHVAATQDPRASDVSTGDSSVTYKGKTDTTDYFETAQTLDPTGTLAADGTKQVDVSVPNARSLDSNSTVGDRY